MDARQCCVCARVTQKSTSKVRLYYRSKERCFPPKTIVKRQEVKSGHKAVSAVQITVVTDKFSISS